jgi:hypothetical protein
MLECAEDDGQGHEYERGCSEAISYGHYSMLSRNMKSIKIGILAKDVINIIAPNTKQRTK